jgi:hypothetical protein
MNPDLKRYAFKWEGPVLSWERVEDLLRGIESEA